MVAITVPLPTLLLAAFIPTVVADLFRFDDSGNLEKKSLDQLASGLQSAGRLRYGKRSDESQPFADDVAFNYPAPLASLEGEKRAVDDYEKLVEFLERYNKRAAPRSFGKTSQLLEALHGTEKLRFGRK